MAMRMPSPLLVPSLFLALSLALLLPPRPAAATSPTLSFSLDSFPAAQLALSGGANATHGAVSLASTGARAQYRTPISVPGPGFSTHFSFALHPAPASAAPPSLAFYLTPPASRSSPPALSVVFSARHVRLDLAGRTARQAHYSPALLLAPTTRRLHAWIDYSNNPSSNSTATDTLHVRLAGTSHPAPAPPLLSYPLHLPPALRRGPVLAGFRTSSGNCTLFSWAFRPAPYRMHSQPLDPADLLTTPPPERVARAPDRWYGPWGAALSLLLAAACGAMLTFLALFLCYSVARRRPVAPVEYPMHPSRVVYEKIVLVGVKDDAAAADHQIQVPPAGNK